MNKRLQLKNIILINIVLISLLNIIPKNEQKEIQVEQIIQNEIKEEIQIEVEREQPIETTSRGTDEPRKEEVKTKPQKNLNLTTTSDLRNISNLTSKEFDKMLKNTNLYGLGQILEQIEKEYKINGLYILGLACLESNYGNSKYAKERNNLVGWNAVDSNTDKASYFKSKSECLLFISKKLKTNYLTKGGKYFNGYTAKAIDIKYCSDKEHANKIIKIVNKLIKKL